MQQTSFGLDGELFEVEAVMSQINNEEPSPFLELIPLEGEMVGHRFLIGEFKMLDEDIESGDDQLQFSVTFPDSSKKGNEELTEKYIETINSIVIGILNDMVTANMDTTDEGA